jgi:hypothetical protein
MGDGEAASVMLVLVRPGVDHLLIRFATFTEPSPVAKSYPSVVLYAGVITPATVVSSTPTPPELVLLQLTAPPAHGTEILPLVTSLNTQVVAGPSVELQLAKASLLASEYNVTFALPCLWPVFWFTSAMIAANVGAAAEVPPTA